MNHNLAEGKFGHGGKPRNVFLRKFKRWKRVNYSKFKKKVLVGAVTPVDWSKPYASPHGAIKNQWSSFSCGGMAGSYLLSIIRFLSGISKVMEEFSAKSIYAPIAYTGGGTTVADLETRLCAHGANLESEVPDLNNGTCTESFMTDKSWMTPDMLEKAIERAGYTPMSVAIDAEAMAEAIRDEGGIIIVVQGQNSQGSGWFAPYPTPPSKNNHNPIWEHFVCGFGYQAPTSKQIDFLNSWGSTVGNGGVQHLNEAYLDSGHVVDCFTIISDSRLTPDTTQGLTMSQLMWQSVLLWFKRQDWFK